MMQLVPRDHIGQRPHADRVSARQTQPPPGLAVQSLEHQHVAPPHGFQFLQQPRPIPPVEPRRRNIRILVEAGQRRLVSTRDPQCPVRHDPLGIDHVPHHLAQAPLALRVPPQRVLLIDRPQRRQSRPDLSLQRAHDIAPRHLLDVLPKVPGVLVRIRSLHRKVSHIPYVTLRGTHTPKMSDSTGEKFQQLVSIMARLRAPGGCPWDREQTFDSIKPFTLEETYEVLDAIDRRDYPNLAEELGDFLLQAVFYAQMASEQNLFTIADSLDAINQKLVRRHPHVFGEDNAEDAQDVLRIWGEAKAAEKKKKGDADATLLGGVPRALPALVEAQQIASRAAGVGFDWENPAQVVDKLHEELAEFNAAQSHDQLEDELGDMLFVIVNLARFVKVDPEQALRRTNAKFRRRFGYLEAKLASQGKQLKDANIEEMEALWQEAKRQ